ncbi:MAG: hypothetical protein ABR591_02810 [Candidatus Velthaea sp.]
MRTLAAAVLAFVIAGSSIAPATARNAQPLPAIGEAKARELLNGPCGTRPARALIAQAQPSATPGSTAPQAQPGEPTASPNASASPSPRASGSPAPGTLSSTPPPPPRAPIGPEQLLPPALPSAAPSFTPPPLPTPTATANNKGPVIVQRVTPEPSGSPSARASSAPSPVPSPAETLGPNQYEVLADDVEAENRQGAPAELNGNVNVFYSEGILVGDHAHYDGTRYIDVTGRPYIRNRSDDTVLHADSIRFDTLKGQAILINGRGQTTQGVETGHFYYTAKSIRTQRDGTSHGERASFTTCDRPHAGYHVEAKTLDIFPNDKVVAHSALLFLGGVAVFFLPVVVIPLTHEENAARRTAGFVPLVGYSQTEGFYIKAKIGFAPSDYYYGYYRVDAFTKLGLGLGYVGFFRRKNGRRSVDVNFYRFRDRQDAGEQNNLQLNDTEIFSQTLRGQFGVNYQGNYAPGVFLPPSYTITGSLAHTGVRESQNYTFNRFASGSTQSSMNVGFTDQHRISPSINQGINLSFTNNTNAFAGLSSSISSIHLNTLTHVTSRALDYDLTFDKTDTASPFGINKLPELLIRPHSALDPHYKFFPITAQFAAGEYSESRSSVSPGDAPVLTTQRAEALLTFGPALAHFLGSDFNASVTARQDAYGTGDLKGTVQQNASLSTPFGRHVINSITYSEQNSNGPQAEPFKTFDIIGGASHQASDVLRIFNADHYTFTLQSSTLFNRSAQPLAYQLNVHPSPRSSLLLGGSYVPGPGNGFFQTNAQVVTPFGRGGDIQFSTNIDWKARGRLESKNIYYRRIIGDCYMILAAYNQDLKQITLTVEILAFPSRAASFGLQTQGSIIPGSLNFASGQ